MLRPLDLAPGLLVQPPVHGDGVGAGQGVGHQLARVARAEAAVHSQGRGYRQETRGVNEHSRSLL